MSSMERAAIEKTKDGFDPAGLLAAREKTWEAVRRIGAALRPGMTIPEAEEAAQAVFASMGAQKPWHRTWIRFGSDTLKLYQVPHEPGIRLEADDIAFVDVGPVWDGYEGDAGDTFTFGDDAEKRRCADDGRELFRRVASRWKAGDTGRALYAFAEMEARRMGWVLNQDANGHRLSDFPHALYFKGSMAEQDFGPSSGLWVLEIQIRHPTKPIGAFYEDLLL